MTYAATIEQRALAERIAANFRALPGPAQAHLRSRLGPDVLALLDLVIIEQDPQQKRQVEELAASPHPSRVRDAAARLVKHFAAVNPPPRRTRSIAPRVRVRRAPRAHGRRPIRRNRRIASRAAARAPASSEPDPEPYFAVCGVAP